MEHTLIVAGIGPGDPDYILPKAQKAIEGARYLVGGRRALSDYAKPSQETYPVTGKLSLLASWLEEALKKDDVIVMVSGDPGYYSLLPWLKKRFPEHPIEVIPGISSVQACFALVKEPWQGALWLSFHGRVPEEKDTAYMPGRKLAFLTDHEHDPAYIARYLMAKGWPKETRAAAAEHISYENQHLSDSTLENLSHLEGYGESVMVVMG